MLQLAACGRTLAALVFASGLVACVSAQQTTPTAPPQSAPAAQQPLAETPAAPTRIGPAKVGLLLPLSGRAGEIGKDMLDAAQMAIFDVGENEVVLVPRDSGESTETTIAAARDLLAGGTELLLGPLFAAAAREIEPIAAAADVRVLSFSNDAAAAGGHVYVLGFRPGEQVERVTRFALDQGQQHLALLAPDDAYGNVVARAFEATLAERQLRGAIGFYPTEGDPSAQVSALLATATAAAPLDAVLVADGGARLVRVASLLRDGSSGNPPRRLLGTGRWQDDPKSLREAALAGGWLAAPSPAAEAAFRDRFRNVFGREPHQLAALAYDATALAVLLERSGRSYDPTLLTDPQGFAGSLGAFRIRSDGTTEHSLAILEVASGSLLMVEPAPQGFPASTAATN